MASDYQRRICRARSYFANPKNTAGYLALAVTGMAIWAGYEVLFKPQPEVIKSLVETRNVLWNEAPETFIEAEGVRYYSKIDGRPLDDLVCR